MAHVVFYVSTAPIMLAGAAAIAGPGNVAYYLFSLLLIIYLLIDSYSLLLIFRFLQCLLTHCY